MSAIRTPWWSKRELRADAELSHLRACACVRASQEFVCFQMISLYGVKSIATRYLQEMVVGLQQKREHHPRASLFARGLQVFPDAKLSMEAFANVSRYLSTLLGVMQAERSITKMTNTASFFAAYASMCTVYVPVHYALATISEMHIGDPKLAAEAMAFGVAYAGAHALPDEAACVAAAKTNRVTKKHAVFGAGGVMPGLGVQLGEAAERVPDLIDCDAWLDALATFYEAESAKNTQAVEDVFAKYDLDGDGRISLEEFRAMLPEMYDLERYPMRDEEVAVLHAELVALGDGQIRHDDLTQLLFHASCKAANKQATHRRLELGDVDHERLELELLVSMWDTQRMLTSAAEMKAEGLDRHLLVVRRIQRCFRRRQRAKLGAKTALERAMTIGEAMFV